MAGRKQPIELVQARGKKHLTKAEIEYRKKTEVKADLGGIDPPDHLTDKQKDEYIKYATQLIDLEIFSELDVETLANWIQARDEYVELKRIRSCFNLLNPDELKQAESISRLQDRAFRQMRSAANDLGLTISSRCRLVVPKTEEKEKENKFARFGTG